MYTGNSTNLYVPTRYCMEYVYCNHKATACNLAGSGLRQVRSLGPVFFFLRCGPGVPCSAFFGEGRLLGTSSWPAKGVASQVRQPSTKAPSTYLSLSPCITAAPLPCEACGRLRNDLPGVSSSRTCSAFSVVVHVNLRYYTPSPLSTPSPRSASLPCLCLACLAAWLPRRLRLASQIHKDLRLLPLSP